MPPLGLLWLALRLPSPSGPRLNRHCCPTFPGVSSRLGSLDCTPNRRKHTMLAFPVLDALLSFVRPPSTNRPSQVRLQQALHSSYLAFVLQGPRAFLLLMPFVAPPC